MQARLIAQKTKSKSRRKERSEPVDLAAIAERLNTRERRSQVDALRCAKEQGEDLIKARTECERQSISWLAWLKENVTEFGQARAYQYIKFAEFLVTRTSLSHEEQWVEWQRISGNAPKEKKEHQPEEAKPEDGFETALLDPASALYVKWKSIEYRCDFDLCVRRILYEMFKREQEELEAEHESMHEEGVPRENCLKCVLDGVV